jgi:uncharacterized protein
MNKLLEYIIKGNLSGIIKEIESGTNINTCDEDGRSLLINAILKKKMEIVKYLIKKGIDINLQDDNMGYTALHVACTENNFEAVQILLENKAKIDIKDNHGNTPLFRATFASIGNGEIIKLLLKNGADKNIKNNYDMSPLDVAKSIANYNIIQFFE